MKPTLILVLLDIALFVAGYGGKNYERWRDPMEKYGFTWKAFRTKTSDDYIISLFRITGTVREGQYSDGRTPVLMVPGLFDDAARWLEM